MPELMLKEIFKKNDDNKLVLPDFQRGFVWTIEQQKKLLASFLVFLPCGSILLLDGNKEDFANKKICYPNESCNPKDECTYLLDGQQRITSLKGIFSDIFSDIDRWEEIYSNIYKALRYRWFIRVIPNCEEDDIFGYNDLNFKGLKSYEPDQIMDYIEAKAIYKRNKKDWYHPAFIVRDKKGNVVPSSQINSRYRYLKEFPAKEGLVPLFTIDKKHTKELHEDVIELIARNRVESIKAEINDIANNNEKNEKIKYYLKDMLDEVTIEEMIEENSDELKDAWANLAAKWSRDIINCLEEILESKISTIELPSNEISRAVAIFDSINKGGTPLNVYDLVVAKAAKDKNVESLSKRIIQCLQQDIFVSKSINKTLYEKVDTWNSKYMEMLKDTELSKTTKKQFLNLISILCKTNYGDVANISLENIKKSDILSLSCNQINNTVEETIQGLVRACAFLQLRCGIISIENIPYELMILPLAYCLKEDKYWNDEKVINKLEYWYWASIFGGAYREKQNQRCIEDLKKLYTWINDNSNNSNPFENYAKKVLNESGYSDESLLLMEDTIHTIPSAISSSILHYILSCEPKDFLYNKLYLSAVKVAKGAKCDFEDKKEVLKIEDHHIYPLGTVTKIGQSTKELRTKAKKSHILNSPLNRTYISSVSNSKISDMEPAKYFKYVTDVAQYKHFIPEIFTKYNPDADEEYYKLILKKRFKEIKKAIVTELDDLIR